MLQFRLDEDLDGAKRRFICLRQDDDGATQIDYSIPIGPLTAAVGDRRKPSGQSRPK